MKAPFTIDYFDAPVSFRAKYYDMNGIMLLLRSETKKVDRPLRGGSFVASIVTSAALAFTSTAYAATEPAQEAMAWPAARSTLRAKDLLEDSLKHLRTLKANWNLRGAPAPIERAISAAQYIIGQLPLAVADARAGVDSEGHVFLRLVDGDRSAYLTVEPKVMHLLYKEPGHPNVYIDEEGFNGKVIPASIKKVLDQRLKS